MKPLSAIRASRRVQSGYSLLLIMFFVTALLIAAAAAAPNLLTQGRREREEEMVWRGRQYARAVKLYYRKNGRFPQSMEDLVKPKGDVRFLRKEYRDPMNRDDGTWRLIYVGPNGQLIGSMKPQAAIQLTGLQPQQPRPPGAAAPPPDAGRQPGEQQPSSTTPVSATPPAVEGQIFGANIIGVGSKVRRTSLRIYDGASNYIEWEFIWDPTKDAIAVGAVPQQPGQPATGTVTPGMPTPPQPRTPQ
jgi:type II secretory pathway pseudopilin PulG